MGGLGTGVIMTWVTAATTGSDDRRLVWEDIICQHQSCEGRREKHAEIFQAG